MKGLCFKSIEMLIVRTLKPNFLRRQFSSSAAAVRVRIEEKRAKSRLGGGEKRVATQHSKGKLTARERIALLLDNGSFREYDVKFISLAIFAYFVIFRRLWSMSAKTSKWILTGNAWLAMVLSRAGARSVVACVLFLVKISPHTAVPYPKLMPQRFARY